MESLKIDPDEQQLRYIKQWVRMRYDRNIEFIPADEVVEMILSYSKVERDRNNQFLKMYQDHMSYCTHMRFVGEAGSYADSKKEDNI